MCLTSPTESDWRISRCQRIMNTYRDGKGEMQRTITEITLVCKDNLAIIRDYITAERRD